MSGRYDDIINMPHHVSLKRKRLSLHDRAAQFNPFAALTGYEDAIQETGRLTDRPIDLAVDGKAMLDGKLRKLAEHLREQPEVTVTYFVPDFRKSGGAYVDVMGRVLKIDLHQKVILMNDGTVIDFEQIADIQAEFMNIDFADKEDNYGWMHINPWCDLTINWERRKTWTFGK